METKINRKMILLEKSNPSLASAKTIIFPCIFLFHFRRSFKLRSNAYESAYLSRWHINHPLSHALPPLQLHSHPPSSLWHHLLSCEWPQTTPTTHPHHSATHFYVCKSSNMGLLKIVFEVNLGLFDKKSTNGYVRIPNGYLFI